MFYGSLGEVRRMHLYGCGCGFVIMTGCMMLTG